jgi:hypothetical protein
VSETHTHTYSERILSELSLWPRPGGAPGACARAGQLDLNLESYGCTGGVSMSNRGRTGALLSNGALSNDGPLAGPVK